VWNLFKKQHKPEAPRAEIKSVGEIAIASGALHLGDPKGTPLVVKGVPAGEHTVRAHLLRLEEDKKIAKVSLTFDLSAPDVRKDLGTLAVSSGALLVADGAVVERHLQAARDTRVGVISAQQHRKLALQIEKQFGLASHPVSVVASEFEESIPKELEAKIKAFLQSLPECAGKDSSPFSIKTRNPFAGIRQAIKGRLWQSIELDESDGTSLLAFCSEVGDYRYSVEGLYSCDALVGVEVEFGDPVGE
jgi:hypothetical protein